VQVCSNGVTYANDTHLQPNAANDWEMHCVQWDFARGSIHSWYNNGLPASDEALGVPAPQGAPQYLRLGAVGALATTNQGPLHFHGLAVWDDLMTVAQMQAIYARGYQDEISESDGTGRLTLLLRLNEGLNAEVAAGEGRAILGTGAAADRWCLLDVGARELGVRRYPIGMPRHEGSEDDRKPLAAVCPLLQDTSAQIAATVDQNLADYGLLRVTGYNDILPVGAYWPSIPQPGTYRQWVHVPDTGNTAGYELGLGPIAYKHYPSSSDGVFDNYGSGRPFSVVADAGNTTTRIKVDLTSRFAGSYWAGARVSFCNGNLRGYAVKVASFDTATGVMVLDTALPLAPAAGSVGFVNWYPRLLGTLGAGGGLAPDYAMEANLWAHHSTNNHFVLLEWQAGVGAAGGWMRYEKGRTAPMSGATFNGAGSQTGVYYGKGNKYVDAAPTAFELWLRKVEVGGPQRYETVRPDPDPNCPGTGQAGPALADCFMVLQRDASGVAGDSVKVWRQQNLTVVRDRPVKRTDWANVLAELQAPGTWRATVSAPPTIVVEDEGSGRVVGALIGKDAAGVSRLGYVVGEWNPTTGRIQWSDEPAPAGRQNPCLDVSTLRSDTESDAPMHEPAWLGSVLEAADGSWSLIYIGRPVLVDAITAFCLHGAPDRWTWDFKTQFAGALAPMFGGVDTRDAMSGNGFVPWANMHAYWNVQKNRYTKRADRKYVAFCGGKTIFNSGGSYSTYTRPIMGLRGSDVKSLRPLPHGNALTPLAGGTMEMFQLIVYGEDTLGLTYSDGNTTGVGMYTSEDGLHWQMLYPNTGVDALLPSSQLPGESFHISPYPSFRLGGQRVYYYEVTPGINYAAIRYNGETSYQLAAGQTEGWMETAILTRPKEGWGELYLNLAPGAGTVQVEVRDPETERALSGWERDKSATLGDTLEGRMTWRGGSLDELDREEVRLRFYLGRPTTGAVTPKLFAWTLAPLVVPAPEVEGLQVDGATAPAGVRNEQPEFSWSYRDPGGRAQTAYHLQVASTEARLAAGTADMWDTGERSGAATTAEYAGAPLGDLQTYFWRVRVRNAGGVWSASW
jgi:hypothetical protein